ncbi:hypothetical protein [Arthrobacter sp. B2a2-09]|uniref:hypothetical protein n=1 Tax=Arthrobacter sp. B2a2-09 TaxID=2952822 RepID=UPI0022CD3ED5|nr:hypothetical protein [Arthrobacter sp. B2a2-09]MCZ9884117.1 hypothetical protein [Arthrobacter sp. B2a2-09]
MKITAEPRSDQWNADDFTGGPRTFTVAGVKPGAAEQKYDIELVEGEGRAWRPPLGMLRVLMNAWGDEASVWVGRRVTLFKDPTVRFGKEVPGGIRISHLSHIGNKPLNVPITVARGSRRTFTVQPLIDDAPQQADLTIPDGVKANTAKAIAEGTVAGYLVWLTENNAPQHFIDYVNTTAKEPAE